MKRFSKIFLSLIALIIMGPPISGQGYNYCILAKQNFNAWGDCRNGAPGFEKAELSIYNDDEDIVSTIEIGENQINKIYIPFEESVSGNTSLPLDLVNFKQIKVHVWANDIRNDTHTQYEINENETWTTGNNEINGNSVSDPCSNNANWSSNREGYNNSTEIYIEGPVIIKPIDPNKTYDCDTEYLVLEFEEFKFWNENQNAVIEYSLTPTDKNSWSSVKGITPGKKAFIPYSQFAGSKKDPSSNYYNYLDKQISFRVKKQLANGHYSTGNIQEAKFTSSGPKFRVLDVRRSFCNDNPEVFVELLDADDGITFEDDRFIWAAKLKPGGPQAECSGTKIDGSKYKLVPITNPNQNPFTVAGEWELQLQISGKESHTFHIQTFTIPEKSVQIGIDQSDEIYPIGSDSPSYHLLDATNPYAIINIDDDELRLPYQIKKIDGTDTLFVATLNHIPTGFEDLSEGEQNNIWENFNDSINNVKGNRNSNWGKYFNLRFEDWFFENLKPQKTDISITTNKSYCSNPFSITDLFVLSENSQYLTSASSYSILNKSSLSVTKLNFPNESLASDYKTFWKKGAKSSSYSFIGSLTSSGHNSNSPGTWLKIDDNGDCKSKHSDATSYESLDSPINNEFEMIDYNGCSFIGKDNTESHYLIVNLGGSRGSSTLPHFFSGIIDGTGSKCAYTNGNGSNLYYYERGAGNLGPWPGNMIDNIRYISSNQFIDYIIYEDANQVRWLQYIIGDFNKEEIANSFFQNEVHHGEWYNDYLETQWKKYLSLNYGYKLYNHTTVNPGVKESYILAASDGCDHPFTIEVKVPPQPEFEITNSVAPSTTCSSDGQLTIKCTTTELLPLTCKSTTLETNSPTVTIDGLAWVDTIQFYNSSLKLTYDYPIEFTDPARGIQDANAQPRTCGDFANGKIAITFASNSTSQKIYRITDEKNKTTTHTTTSNSYTFPELDGNKVYSVSVSTDECTINWGEKLHINNKIFKLEAHKTDAAIIGEEGSAEITVTNLPDNTTWTGTAYAEGITTESFALGNHTIKATHEGCVTEDKFEILEPGFTADVSILKKENDFVVSISNFIPNNQVKTGSLTIEDDQGNTYEENTEIPASKNYSIIFNYDGHTKEIYDFSANTFNDLSTDHTTSIPEQLCPDDEVTITIEPETNPLLADFEGIFTEDLSFATKNSSLSYAVKAITQSNAITSSSRLDIQLALESDATISIPQATKVSGSFKYYDVTCYNKGDGQAEVFDLSGGSGSYNWKVSKNGNWLESDEIHSSLVPGQHDIYLKDSQNDCQEIKLGSFPITQPNRLLIINPEVTEPSCELDNGFISTEITGGNFWYKYEWKLGNETISATTSCSEETIVELDSLKNGGQYKLIVTDTLGCDTDSDFDLRTYINPSISDGVGDSVRCYNEQNGKITITDLNESTYIVDSLFLFNQANEHLDTILYSDDSNLEFVNLKAGQYHITLRDTSGCKSNEPYTITVDQPDSLYLLTDTIRPVISKGESSGIISGRVFNGNPGLKFMELMPDTAPGTIIDTLRAINEREFAFHKISAGTYRIQSTDHKKCTFISQPFLVKEPKDSLRFEVINRRDALCKAMTGSFEVQGTGGWGAYQYKRIIENEEVNDETGFTSLKSFDGLSAGSYIMTIRDALGGIFRDTVIIISPTEYLHASVEDIILPSCGSNGSFNVDVGGGTGPYKLAFRGSSDTIQANTPGLLDYLNRPPGAYTLIISDDMGCYFNLETQLSNDSLLTIETPLGFGYPSAPGSADGWMKANATGGQQPLEYQWNNGMTGEYVPNGTGPLLSQIPAGYYEIVVSDTDNCRQTELFFLSDINDGQLNILERRGETSWQAGNGYVKLLSPSTLIDSIVIQEPDRQRITVKPPNLPDGYTIMEDTITLQNLSPGSCLVTAWYPDSLKATAQFKIEAYEQMVFTEASITPAHSVGMATGRIEVDVKGGVAPYAFQWEALTGDLSKAIRTNEGNTTIADSIKSGTYRLTATDAYNNEVATDYYVEEPEQEIKIRITDYQHVTCKNSNNAFVKVEASGGWGDYQFRKSGDSCYQNSSAWVNLAPKNHLFITTDKLGVRKWVSFTITEPDSLRATIHMIDSVKCADDANGAVAFDISGGTAPYKFAGNNNSGLWTTDTVASNLPAGTFTYVFSDANNCIGYDTLTAYVPEPDPLEFGLTDVTHTTCDTDNGNITVSMQGGTMPYRYEWLNASGKNMGTSNSLSQLRQGAFYEVNVRDKNNCYQHFEQVIRPSTNPLITEIETTPVLCQGDSNGEATVANVRTASPYAPYSFEWSNNQEGENADGFAAGSHFVTVRDTNNCETTRFFEIDTPDPLGLNILALRNAHCYGYSDGKIHIDPKGGVGQYAINWSNGDTTAIASELSKGSYSVLLSDSNDCSFEQSFEIDEPEVESVYVGEDILMCPGNSITVDGKDFTSHQWGSNGETLSEERYLTVDKEGRFYLKVTNSRGCFAYDTINVEIGNDALQADFLMTSEAFLNDTLEIFELSNLPLDSMTWEYKPEIFADETPAIADDYVLYLKTLETGMYNVTLYAYSGGCFSNIAKQVEIIEGDNSQAEDELLGYQDPLIKSFIVSPNPNPGNFSVDVELRETADIYLAIFSVTEGFKIEDTENTGLKKYHENFTLNGINTGVYVVVLTVEDERRQVKIVVE